MKPWLTLATLAVALLAACDAGKVPISTANAATKPSAVGGDNLAAPCAKCHGKAGTASAQGVPYIGGQRADYLVASMRAYRDGSRKHEAMRVALATFNENDLASIAAHYAGLSATWKGGGLGMAAEGPKTPPLDHQAIAAGKVLSTPCVACHGAEGVSERPEYPSLAGLPANYTRDALRGYFKGGRHHPYMSMFKTALSDSDMRNLAAYCASLTPRRSPLPVAGNIAAGKAKAAACIGCHGAEGNSMSPDFPSLTGQNAGYLDKAIADYRDGRRKHAMMKSATARLSKQDTRDLAAYFAGQQPVKMGSRTSTPSGNPLADGARLAASCDGCHGSNGNSRMSGTPSLTGLSAPFLAKAITEYRDGGRKHSVMQGMVASLSDMDIEKLSLHYALRKPVPASKPAKGDSAAGERLSSSCAGCHGKQGRSSDSKTPSLAGQDPAYLAEAIAAYASGARDMSIMQNAVKGLKKADIQEIAAYYGRQAPTQPKTRIPETTQHIAARCDRCHGSGGRGANEKPRLAGQAEGYLVSTLTAYQIGARKHPAMNAMAQPLSLIEIRALAGHYAKQ